MRATLEKLKPVRDQGSSHPGLLLQRYVFHPADGSEQWSDEKRAILQAAIYATVNEEVRALYRIAFERWSAFLPSNPAPIDLATPALTGRLIVGLGSENVLETGIRLHHTYGMPIIPGSALKGLTAHYCHQVWGPTDKRFQKPTQTEGEAYRKFLAGKAPKPEDNFHRLLFGTTDDGGCITFHDAWYIPDSSRQPLALDVMTPHHPKWLDGSVAPTDFDSPTPVPFLSVTGAFRLAVSWRGPPSDKAENWMELARSLLSDALKDWGVGGKTTSGYGRMVALQDGRASSTSTSRMAVAAPGTRAGKRDFGTPVTVKFLGPREGKPGFRLQEQGKPEGILNQGTQPSKLPDVNQEIQVFIHDDAANPQYRWDKPAQKPQSNARRGPGGRRPPQGR